jgi:HlyD family secretion protein
MPMTKGRAGLVWGVIALAVAAALVVVFRPAPVEVEVAPVVRGAFERTIDEDGKTRVRERYVVSAPLAGRVLRSNLKAGDAVKAGDVIATLMPAAPALIDARAEQELRERLGAAEAAHARANAEVERARVALEQSRGELSRATQLADQGFTSPQALERNQRDVELKVKEQKSAEFEREAARHEVGVARAALTRSQVAWSRPSARQWALVAPVAGRVLRVVQESEAAIGLGAPLVEIGNPEDLEVVVDVLTTDTPAIRRGQPVRLDVGAGTPPLAGRVRLVEPAAFTKVSALGVEEQRVNVVIDFDAPREAWQALGDAYRVDAHVVVEARQDAVVAPVSALFRQGERWNVFVADGGRARRVEVAPGPRNATQAVIERGLEPGAEVIVFPGDRVADGARISVRH